MDDLKKHNSPDVNQVMDEEPEAVLVSTPKRHSAESEPINMRVEHEVRLWTQTLGVSREKLQAAINVVGPSADKVREFLWRARPRRT